ncbi:MAG: exodeoxyribonuclease V subunit gamma, partial [Desulfobacteraceae bacterium]|nr:exodeoxyribonuclease V subunit gamma [Desulfobacteraceae bacterium]
SSSSMLSILQSDIMNLVFRKAGSDNLPLAVDTGDDSVCIHACHSPMREAQVLKDLLLDAFEKDSGLCPHEVIVMMPDIETYAPYLEAVFSSEHSLPFSISDRRKKSESQTLEAFLKILALKDSRLEQTRVLDLLLSPAIAAKFDVLAEDLVPIEAAIREAGILWGRDGAHRKELTHAEFDENTWMFGFKRLFMGYGLAEGAGDLVEGVLPCDAFEGLEARILGKIAHFGYTLFERLADLSLSKTIGEWGGSFKNLVLSMMEKSYANEADIVFLLQTIDTFVRDGEMAGYDRKIDFSVARDIIETKLDKSISQGSFLAGNITFCNLMPMRSIPFKVVALMGMDEPSFPRKPVAVGFDLIKKYSKPGDKQERDEDRYLFLESLLSARDRLIITYTGMSIKDNSPIPCSGVVEEFKDVIKDSFEFPEKFDFCFHHPLHPFSPVYFSQQDFHQAQTFFSFSQDQCKIAVSQVAMEKEDAGLDSADFLPGGFSLDPKDTAPVKTMDQEVRSVTIDELINFFRNPVEFFVTRRLNLSFPGIEELAPDREDFQLSGLSRYGLGSYYMGRTPKTDLYPLVRAAGLLPFGQKGRSEWDRVKAIADP